MATSAQTQNAEYSPKSWTAEDAYRDKPWIQYLSHKEHDGFQSALEHALKVNKPFLEMTQEDYPLPPVSQQALRCALATVKGRRGMCLIKGFPTDKWTESEMRLAYWGIGLYMGVARPQNRAGEVIVDVRDAGGGYKVKGGRGYNTNAGLDFHQVSVDVVALLCRRTAETGGASQVVSSIALRDRVAALRPGLTPVLQANNWYHSHQGAQDRSQSGYHRCSILDNDYRFFCARTNRKNSNAAQEDFPEVPKYTPEQVEALYLLDRIIPLEDYCYTMELERGNIRLLISFVTLHSRTPFEDHENPDKKRHLMRLWLSVPGSQPLPSEWADYWGDVRANAVRGGLCGTTITSEYLAYEKRQAGAFEMHCTH
ncbi:TfdA family Taurine catabolism dioxygenase TauD [Seiridium cupressi]